MALMSSFLSDRRLLRPAPAAAGLFVGRTGELARLDAALADPGGVVVQAVHGLGGVGKSTLAAWWAAAHAGDYILTWWITAATPTDIDAGLAALAAALQPALSGVLPLEALREGAVQWLTAHSGWLLILDNVTDPADIEPLLARAPAGRYLITSRRATGWHATGAVPVRLDVLDPAEAEALLTKILTQDQPRDLDGAAGLCAELGFLPLAIEQAGAYLAQAGATPREYLDLLARYPAAMHQAAPEGGDAARTIARVRSARVRAAPRRSAPEMPARVSVALRRSALVRSAPVRRARVRSAPARLIAWMSRL
jgi:hypothetical protein